MENTHRNKYSLASNIVMMLKAAWQADKSFLFILAVLIISDVIIPVLNMYLPSKVLELLENSAEAKSLVILIILISLGRMVFGSLSTYISEVYKFNTVKIRIRHFLIGSLEKNFHADYEDIEKDVFLNAYTKAQEMMDNNISPCEEFYRCLGRIATAIAGVIIYGFILFSISPVLIPLSSALIVLSFLARKKSNDWTAENKDNWTPIDRKKRHIASVAGRYDFAKDIRIFGMGGWIKDIYDSLVNLRFDWAKKESGKKLLADFAECFLTFFREGAAYLILIYMAAKGEITASGFILYFAAISNFSDGFLKTMNEFSELHRMSLGVSDFRAFVDFEEKFNKSGTVALEKEDLPCSISLKNLHYKYDGAKTETIKGIDLEISPGEKIAIVGLNGAGKTSLIKMICGLANPTEGEILISGKNMLDFNRKKYYTYFSVVFQEFLILPLTIAENIAITDNGVDREKVEECLKKADLLEKIESLPKGMDSLMVKEVYYDAATLSGGETQRLMLARAVYKDAPIIILDEPTAALDPIAEAAIYQRYNELTEGKTSIYISHRLSSTQFCDRIIYLENGLIAETGTHEELMAKKGKYYELFEVQSAYYKDNIDENYLAKGGLACE